MGLALSARRNALWFGMVAAPPLAEALATFRRAAPRAMPERPAIYGSVAALMLCMVVPALPWIKPRLRLPMIPTALLAPGLPLGAIEALRRLPPGVRPRRLFHSEGVGSYLTWAAPEQRIFIDPRFELYPFSQWQDVVALAADSNAEERLARYRCDGALLNRDQRPDLLRRLRADGRWHVVYEDHDGALLVATVRPGH
jgi:hypothetical protein